MRLSIKVKIFSLFPLLVACAPAPHAMDNQPRTVENKPPVNGKPECAIFQSHGFVCPELMLSSIDINSCRYVPNHGGNPEEIICAPANKNTATTDYGFYPDGSGSVGTP